VLTVLSRLVRCGLAELAALLASLVRVRAALLARIGRRALVVLLRVASLVAVRAMCVLLLGRLFFWGRQLDSSRDLLRALRVLGEQLHREIEIVVALLGPVRGCAADRADRGCGARAYRREFRGHHRTAPHRLMLHHTDEGSVGSRNFALPRVGD